MKGQRPAERSDGWRSGAKIPPTRGFPAANLGLFAAAARWHRGRLIGGSEGAALVGEAIVTMRAADVAAPERMARALLAGVP